MPPQSILCVWLFPFRSVQRPSVHTMVRAPFRRPDFVTNVTCRFDCLTFCANRFDQTRLLYRSMWLIRYASSLHWNNRWESHRALVAIWLSMDIDAALWMDTANGTASFYMHRPNSVPFDIRGIFPTIWWKTLCSCNVESKWCRDLSYLSLLSYGYEIFQHTEIHLTTIWQLSRALILARGEESKQKKMIIYFIWNSQWMMMERYKKSQHASNKKIPFKTISQNDSYNLSDFIWNVGLVCSLLISHFSFLFFL